MNIKNERLTGRPTGRTTTINKNDDKQKNEIEEAMIRLFDAKEVWNKGNHHISLVYYLLTGIWNGEKKSVRNVEINSIKIRFFSLSLFRAFYNLIISSIRFMNNEQRKKPRLPCLSRHKARHWWNLWFEQIINNEYLLRHVTKPLRRGLFCQVCHFHGQMSVHIFFSISLSFWKVRNR